MYELLELLDPGSGRQRIFPLSTYPHLSKQLVVPIIYMEIQSLARYWPIAWVQNAGIYAPVAVIGFSQRQNLLDRLGSVPADAIPVAIKAYPFALSPVDEEGNAKILYNPPPPKVDPVFGDLVFLPDGSLSPAAAHRTDFLWLHAAEQKRTREFTRRIAEAGGFELWKLKIVFADSVIENTQFHCIRPHFLSSRDYLEIASDFGPALVMALEQHVISRLHIQALADEMPTSRPSG